MDRFEPWLHSFSFFSQMALILSGTKATEWQPLRPEWTSLVDPQINYSWMNCSSMAEPTVIGLAT